MRKTDKQNRKNKPSDLNKIDGNRLGTLKPTKEELANSEELLKYAKKLEINQDVKKVKQGFSYEFEKMKAEINKRKNNRKFLLK